MMHKILIGVILASSLAMSGDLAKCTEAYQEFETWSEAYFKEKNLREEVRLARKENDELAKLDLTVAWLEIVVKECEGIFKEGTHNNYKKYYEEAKQVQKREALVSH